MKCKYKLLLFVLSWVIGISLFIHVVVKVCNFVHLRFNVKS